MKWYALAVSMSIVSACASAAVNRGPEKNPAGIMLAFNLGCERDFLDTEWKYSRYADFGTGENVCVALGRWGEPYSSTEFESEFSKSASLSWVRGGRMLSVMATRYKPGQERLGTTAFYKIDSITRD